MSGDLNQSHEKGDLNQSHGQPMGFLTILSQFLSSSRSFSISDILRSFSLSSCCNSWHFPQAPLSCWSFQGTPAGAVASWGGCHAVNSPPVAASHPSLPCTHSWGAPWGDFKGCSPLGSHLGRAQEKIHRRPSGFCWHLRTCSHTFCSTHSRTGGRDTE